MAKKKDSFMDTLKGATGGFAPAWRPEKDGDMLVGTITGFGTVDGDYGRQIVCTILDEDTDEEVSLYLSAATLRSGFDRARPKVGERIGIKYLGKVPSKVKGYQPYKNFVVKVDREEDEALSYEDVAGGSGIAAPWDQHPVDDEPEEEAPPEPAAKKAGKKDLFEADDDLPF